MKAGLALAGALVLAGCVAQTAEQPAPAARPPAPPPAARPRPIVVPLDTVIGRTAAALAASFGTPALDIREGTARKLQFESAACVLDAYLYPPAAGGEPIVTHVDTRLPDGRDIDRASCVAALGAARARR
jgi:hypothetical protein